MTNIQQVSSFSEIWGAKALRHDYVPGETIKGTEEGKSLFLVVSGAVVVVVEAAGAIGAVPRLLHAGDVFGLEQIVGRSRRYEAVARARILALPVTALQEDQGKLLSLMRRVAEQASKSQEMFVRLSSMGAEDRLYEVLLHFGRVAGTVTKDGVLLEGVSRIRLAQCANLSRETCCRSLAYLERQGKVLRQENRDVLLRCA